MPVIFEQKKFDKGEVSPSFLGRSDLSVFNGAVSKLRNAIVTEVGSVRKRPGFERIASVGTGGGRLIPFQFNITQAYVILFEISKVRVFFNTTQVASLTSPYKTLDDVRRLKYAQSGDVLFLTNRDFPPMRLIRKGHTDWVFELDAENFWMYEVVPQSWGNTGTSDMPEPETPPSTATGLRFSPPGGSVREQPFSLRIVIDTVHTQDIVVAVSRTVGSAAPVAVGTLTITAGAKASSALAITPLLQGGGPTTNVISGTVTSGGIADPTNVSFVNRQIP